MQPNEAYTWITPGLHLDYPWFTPGLPLVYTWFTPDLHLRHSMWSRAKAHRVAVGSRGGRGGQEIPDRPSPVGPPPPVLPPPFLRCRARDSRQSEDTGRPYPPWALPAARPIRPGPAWADTGSISSGLRQPYEQWADTGRIRLLTQTVVETEGRHVASPAPLDRAALAVM